MRESRLEGITTGSPDIWAKKAEAFSYLGEDQKVLDAFQTAQQTDRPALPHDEALLYHLAAVAAMRLGREAEARRHWQEALKLMPGMEVAEANRADLQLPVGQRNAPWSFALPQWLKQKALKELAVQIERAARRDDEEEMTRAARRYLDQHPEVAALVPILLDRGGPEARGFALRLAIMAETPDMLTALKEFAVGQRGPDAMRMEAARAATRGGLLPSGSLTVWLEGEWREIMTVGFDIYSEAESRHAPQVEEWLRDATLALRAEDPDRAEQLLRQALAVEPDAVDVLNNLAATYEMQGRRTEAYEMVQEIFQRDPDYLFGRTGVAQFALRDGKLEEAEALLKPLLERRRLHFSEFEMLCKAMIELFIAQGSRDAARAWLDLWAATDPDNPQITAVRRRIGEPNQRRGLFRGPR